MIHALLSKKVRYYPTKFWGVFTETVLKISTSSLAMQIPCEMMPKISIQTFKRLPWFKFVKYNPAALGNIDLPEYGYKKITQNFSGLFQHRSKRSNFLNKLSQHGFRKLPAIPELNIKLSDISHSVCQIRTIF